MNPHLTPTRTRILLACGLAAALTLGALTTLAHATAPGKNGLIAFTRWRLQDNPLWSEIFVANPDGTGERQVSHSTSAVEDNHAHWSPDGKWIVFDRCTANGPCSLWLVRPDGAGQHRLSPPCSVESSAIGLLRRQRPVLRPRRSTRRVHARVGPRQADRSRRPDRALRGRDPRSRGAATCASSGSSPPTLATCWPRVSPRTAS